MQRKDDNMNLIEFYRQVPIQNTQMSMFQEVWLPITWIAVPNIKPNCYYISNFGRVYSFNRNCLLTPQETNCGYYRVPIRLIDGKQVYCSVHRLVMITFEYIPNYESMQVNHSNCKKDCNYQFNLEWNTPSENIIHAFNNGLSHVASGEDAQNSTITNQQAEQICQLIIDGKSHKEIANIIGCAIHIVDNISAGATWKEFYNKYNLSQYKREPREGFSDKDLHKLCKYFEDNKNNNYKTKTELFDKALYDLFGIRYNNSMSANMSRIYNKKTRNDITSQYNY